jgi:hypothetical protein
MPLITATDTDFNADTRKIEVKLDIYFSSGTFTVSVDDYLISCIIHETAGESIKNPFGSVMSNELSFVLFNETGLFTPLNTASSLYGQIKKGVKVIPYIRPVDLTGEEEYNWIQMGEYYVVDWLTEASGSGVHVFANDRLLQVFRSKNIELGLLVNNTYKQLLEAFFAYYSITATVASTLTDIVPYANITKVSPRIFLDTLVEASLSLCSSNKTGGITITDLTVAVATRAIMTDADQLISIDTQQSVSKTYDGISLTYYVPQILISQEVLSLLDIAIPMGTMVHDTKVFTKSPVKFVENITVHASTGSVIISAFTNSNYDIILTTLNAIDEDVACNISVYGSVIDFKDILLVSGDGSLAIDNQFIQDPIYAVSFLASLNAFITSDVPFIKMRIRGNPLLNIGEEIQMISTRYNLDYTGIIYDLKYVYTGGLSCEMTLINKIVLD